MMSVFIALLLSGAATAHLWVYAEGEGLLVTVQRDEELMERIRAAWDGFQPYLDSDTPPPLTDADSAQRDDPSWAEAAVARANAAKSEHDIVNEVPMRAPDVELTIWAGEA